MNGKLVPLDYELRTGDTVEILTSKAQGEGPSQDWLRCVKTPRARNKIRQWFCRERREDALEDGREQLQRLMRKQNVPFKRLATEDALEQLADEMKFPTSRRCTSRWARARSRRSRSSPAWRGSVSGLDRGGRRPRSRSRGRSTWGSRARPT